AIDEAVQDFLEPYIRLAETIDTLAAGGLSRHEDLRVIGVSDRFSHDFVLGDGRRAELEIQVRLRVVADESHTPLPLAEERRLDGGRLVGRYALVHLGSQGVFGIVPQRPLHLSQGLATLLELPLRMQGHQVGELLRGALLRPVAVAGTLTGGAHGLDESDLVLTAHNPWSFREVLDKLADEEVLPWVRAPPDRIPNDVPAQALQQFRIRHHDGLLPAVCLQMTHVPDAQQHDDALPASRRAVGEIALVAVAVPV